MPFLALFAAVLLLGIADSMAHSYIVLFGADVAGLTPVQIGVWSSVFAIGGITISWWLVVFPGLLLGLTLFALNFLGDGLRDALDPRMKNKD